MHVLQTVEPDPVDPQSAINGSPARRAPSPQSPAIDSYSEGSQKVTGQGAKGKTMVWAWGSTGEEKVRNLYQMK